MKGGLIQMKRILITGARAPISYAVVQQQVALGNQVYLTDSTNKVSIKNTKFIEKFIMTTSPRFSTQEYIEDINSIVREYDIDYILPLNEESFYLSYSKHLLAAPVWVEDIDKMLSVHNKFNFTKLMQEMGFKVPDTSYVYNKKELTSFITNHPDEHYIVKQPFGRFGQSVRKLSRYSLEFGNEVRFPFMIQTLIYGTEWCSYSMAYEGQALSTSLYLSNTHESYNCSTHFHSQKNPELQAVIEEVISKLNWSYQIAFDVIQCSKTGEFYFIECNPRATNGALFMKPEVWNLEVTAPTYEVRQLIFVSLFNWMKKPKKDTFEKLKYGKDVFWHPNEKVIFFEQLISGAQWWVSAKRKKVAVNAITTYDIEWNDELISL
ncbi:ATP-grasp domain-containing protein [Macrococcus brunensis]|uniref:ATP-grasp domain-containing protein n=2 Tax=Macrococcus brunensis TaxID=198483 RepID=A0A4R6BE08_9STAP|nr:ATP-grasp domain-containing protein [Macrococcus brunensis]TDL97968.1 ATP-grasp domain-containing protein [Macrococcus brunensis]ULG71772.1 ATP-grasp domain-containing protein [Macrococcus brunensis]ULG74030.1 ATP-grasp domain-containing protein [Macrococcus brunensis]